MSDSAGHDRDYASAKRRGDDLVAKACLRAAGMARAHHSDGRERTEPKEAELEAALLEGLDVRATSGLSRKRWDLPDWKPRLLGPDIALLDDHHQPWYVIELKISDVDQMLWDLLKTTAAARRSRPLPGALIIATSRKRWSLGHECTELFPGKAGQRKSFRDTVTLFEANRQAWERLLKGGSARPRRIPRSVAVTALVDEVRVAAYPDLWLRAVTVERLNDEDVELEGDWPPGLRSSGR